MRTILSITAAAALLAIAGPTAQAHTTAFGFIPQANGDVEFYIGTYDHGTPPQEGSLSISGVGTFAFDGLHTNTTAAALGLTAPDATYTENTSWGGPNIHFQSVTVGGLSSGSYSFDIAGMSSSHWVEISAFPFPITASVTVSSVVPEPSSLALLGMGVAGLAAARRRRRKASEESDNEA
ncbi:PEP-CTERM motif protein [Maioricimonas rarisocia]|uniref:PEP-CTERM motif protein n=1 Tax=Maioricimonas rarisocia TaxID=2528026 RepID=A0A517Z2W5_9PLAN|nr:PEP-CTERM sorting domain-containing protein [Maioricimonas rarisocia]QDU36815.1 PEP-CTERM motif protein [Maioricimonas rarisocia]